MRIGRRVACLGLLLLPAGAARAQEDAALARVMAGLAAMRERRARFIEEKVIPQLDQALTSEGTLRWSAPDSLERHTTWPIEERISVAGGRITYERADRGVRRDFALDEQPEMSALVEAIRGTLAGDLARLRRHYQVAFGVQADGSWRMVLTPLSLRVRAAVQRIVVTGEGAEIRGLESEEGGGVTRMRISAAP